MKTFNFIYLLLLPLLSFGQAKNANLSNCTNILVWDFEYTSTTDKGLAELLTFDVTSCLTEINPGCFVMERNKDGDIEGIIKAENNRMVGKISDKEKGKLSDGAIRGLQDNQVKMVLFGTIKYEGSKIRIEMMIISLLNSKNLSSKSLYLSEEERANPKKRMTALRKTVQEMVNPPNSPPMNDVNVANKKIKIHDNPPSFSNGEKWTLGGIGSVSAGLLGYGITNMVQGKSIYRVYKNARVEDSPEYTTESREERFDRANKKYVTGQVLVIGGAAILAGGTWWLCKELRANESSGISGVKSKASLSPLAIMESGQTRVGISLLF